MSLNTLLTFLLIVFLTSCVSGESGSDPEGVPPSGAGGGAPEMTPFTVEIERHHTQLNPTEDAPIRFKVDFERPIDPDSFAPSDIIQTGTAPNVTWTITQLDSPRSFFLDGTPTDSGTVIPTMNAGKVRDSTGNVNFSSTGVDNSVQYNYVPVSVSINQSPTQIDPACETNVVFDVVFGVAIDPATFTLDDINQNGTASSIEWEIVNSGDNTQFTIEATVVNNPGTIIPSLDAGAVLSATGKPSLASSSEDNNVMFANDLSVNIEQGSSQVDPATDLPIVYDLKFCRPINASTFDPLDISSDTGSASGITWQIENSGDSKNFTIRATSITTGGTVIPTLQAATVQDNDGADNIVSNSNDNSVTYSNTFSVRIEQASGQSDPTNSLPIAFDVIFSNPINIGTFTTTDIVEVGSADGITWDIANPSGDLMNFTLEATAITLEGTVIPTIAANSIINTSGTLNAASTSTDNEVTFRTSFDVNIEQASTQNDPSASLPVEFTITFSEAINPSSFDENDIGQTGDATTVQWNLINSGNDTVYTLRAIAGTTEGTIIPIINQGNVLTTYGAQNNASTGSDNSVLYSTTFTVEIDQGSSQGDPANILPIEFDVTFGREIDSLTFDESDITLHPSSTASGITWSIVPNGDDINFTLRATAVTTDGIIKPIINANAVQDSGGANNLASTSGDNEVTYNNELVVEIEQKTAQADPTNTLPIEFDIIFNRPIDISSFDETDIDQDGSATGVTWSITNPSGDLMNFTLQATSTTSDGTITPSIAADSVDLQADTSIKNLASVSIDNEVTYDTTAPLITITTPSAPGSWHSTTIDIDGTCDETGGTVNLTLDGGTVTTTATCDGSSWSVSGLDISTITDAINITIAADLDDLAGNSATTATEEFNKDTVSPSDVTAVNLGATNDALFTQAHSANWSVSTDADSGLSHYLFALGTTSGGEDIMTFSDIGTVISYQAISPADFAGELQTDKDYFISIKAVDNAGNESAVLTSSAFEVFNWIKVTGNTCAAGTNLNQATPSPMLWSSSTTPSGYFNHSVSANSDQITVSQAGDYTINVNIPVASAIQRTTVKAQVFVNGSALSYAVTQSSYMRNLNEHSESTAVFNAHLSLAANDIVTVRVSQSAAAGTATSPLATTYLEYIKPVHNIFSATGTQTVAGTNLNQASPFLWASEIQKDPAFSHPAGSQSITLNNAGNYLVYVNIPLTSPVARVAPQLQIKLNGSNIPGGIASQGYIRNSSGHIASSLHYSGLITATAGQILTVDMAIEAATGTVAVSPGNQGHIYIQQLSSSPDGLISLRGSTTTAGANWNSSTGGTNLLWSSQDIYDNLVYSHILNTSTITVGEDGNYLIVYNDHLFSTGQRPNPKIRVKVNGVPRNEASCATHYIRSSNGHNESSCSMVIMLEGLTSGDNIDLDAVRETTNTSSVTSQSDAKIFIIKKAE